MKMSCPLGNVTLIIKKFTVLLESSILTSQKDMPMKNGTS